MLGGESDSITKGPAMRSENFTSRVAGWSAAHRGAVVKAWLGFVLVAFALGALAGMVQLKTVEAENGQSRLADLTQAQQFPQERAGEEILIENQSGPLTATVYAGTPHPAGGRRRPVQSARGRSLIRRR